MDRFESSLAEYNELIRTRAFVTDALENEFLHFVLNHESTQRVQHSEILRSNQELKLKLRDAELEISTLTLELNHARSQIVHEIKKRQKLEQEKNALKCQISSAQGLNSKNNDKDLGRLTFLNSNVKMSYGDHYFKRGLAPNETASLLSPNDISYDKTEDDIYPSFLRNGKIFRPVIPFSLEEDGLQQLGANDLSRNENKQQSNSAELMAADVRLETLDSNVSPEETQITSDRRRSLSDLCKSLKDSLVMTDDIKDDAFVTNGITIHPGASAVTTSSSETPEARQIASGGTLTRPHNFISRICMKPETCIACGKRLRFGKTAMRCKDCRADCHVECKDLMPLPCAPPISSTFGGSKTFTGLISDYASLDLPMIPAIVIHCVNEVEARGFNEVGIYRVSGSEKEVKELKEKFLQGRGTPNLNLISDIHVVCGCLKDFLRGLKEPLVTYRLWHDFAKAAAKPNRFERLNETHRAISQLPRPNRDTLALMILHLQRVAETPVCKMSSENLAKVFGPTIIGYSTLEPDEASVVAEINQQLMVIELLMSIPSVYWKAFINPEVDFDTPKYCHALHSATEVTESPLEHRKSKIGVLETVDRSQQFAPRFGNGIRPTPAASEHISHIC